MVLRFCVLTLAPELKSQPGFPLQNDLNEGESRNTRAVHFSHSQFLETRVKMRSNSSWPPSCRAGALIEERVFFNIFNFTSKRVSKINPVNHVFKMMLCGALRLYGLSRDCIFCSEAVLFLKLYTQIERSKVPVTATKTQENKMYATDPIYIMFDVDLLFFNQSP